MLSLITHSHRDYRRSKVGEGSLFHLFCVLLGLCVLAGMRIEAGSGQVSNADPVASAPAVADVTRFGPIWSFGFGGSSVVDYAPDGKKIVASGSNVLFIINAESYAIEAQWFAAPGGILSLKWSPDGSYIASGSAGALEIWDVETGARVFLWEEPSEQVRSVAWSPDSKYLASADRNIKIWDVGTGKLDRTIQTFMIAGEPNSIAWSPDGRYLALGTFDVVVRIWDADSGALVHELRGHTGTVTSVAWSPDGKYLASGSHFPDGTTRVWEVEEGRLVWTFSSTPVVESVAWGPDGTYLAASGYIYIWDVRTGERVRILDGGRRREGVGHSIAWSPDGKHIVLGGARIVEVWEVWTGDLLAELYGHRGEATAVTWHPEGTFIASGSQEPLDNSNMKIWDRRSGTARRTIPDIVGCRSVDSVDWSPDGRHLASANGCSMLRIWDPETGDEILRLERAGRSATWSPGGEYLASGGTVANPSVRIWEVEKGRLIQTLEGVVTAAWSPDGDYLACGGADGTLKVFAVGTWNLIRTIQLHNGPTTPVWSPDSRYIASPDGTRAGLYDIIPIWEFRTGTRVRTMTGPLGSLSAVTWSPDGCYLAAAYRDFPVSKIGIWEVETERQVTTLLGHTGFITSVRWDPSGQYIASSSYDGSVRLWGVGQEEIH